MNIFKNHLSNGIYFTTVYDKFSTFLHHTETLTAKSAWRWWNSTPDRVGTAFILDRDGTIWECFDPKNWAFHLGISTNNHHLHKHSIGIELVSAGHLYYENGEFRFYPLWPNKQRFNIIPEEEVITLSREWRNYKYFHNYTEAQLESLKWLLGRLALDFPTLKFDNKVSDIFEYDRTVISDNREGLWAHCTIRENKSDIFPYKPLIKVLEELQSEIMDLRQPTQIKEVTKKANKTKKKASG